MVDSNDMGEEVYNVHHVGLDVIKLVVISSTTLHIIDFD